MAWLENKIYILYIGSTTLRVFTDQAPFDELLEAVQIPTLGKPLNMIANAVSRAIFISDCIGYIYKIQMPTGKIRRWESLSLYSKLGLTTRMSNSTALGNCLLTSFLYKPNNVASIQYELQLFSQLDGGLQRNSAILLPKEMKYVGHVVHSPKKNFVISYSKTFPATKCWISILSCNGGEDPNFRT